MKHIAMRHVYEYYLFVIQLLLPSIKAKVPQQGAQERN